MLDALWERVRLNPRDDEARRVLGDALLEAGDPRGELIAVQCQLAAVDADERGPELQRLVARENELLDAHGAGWVEGWPFDLKPRFVRGFPERQHGPAMELVRHYGRARELAPTLCDVVFTDEEPRAWSSAFRMFVAAYRDRPFRHLTLPVTFAPRDLEALEQLDVEALTFTGGVVNELGAAAGLRGLTLEFDVGLRAVPSTLRTLVLRGNEMPSLPQLPELERLTLDRVHTRVTPTRLPKLARLELFDTELGKQGLHAVLSVGHPRVRRLGLRGERLDGELAALLERWPGLEVLDVRGCTVPPRALDAPAVQRLRTLLR